MNENVESLVLELLRSMRTDMATMRDDIGTIKVEMLIMRQHMAGVIGSQTLQGAQISGLALRLERVERRLELID